MKTLEEVLETLEEPYRSQALDNLDLEYDPEGWGESDKNQSDAVLYGFAWDESKEDSDYWNLFHDKLESKEL